MQKTTIYENTFCGLFYLPEYQVIEHKFYSESKHLQDPAFQKFTLRIPEACQDFESQLLLINNEESHFIISNELQAWMHKTIYPRLAELGVKRKAFVISFNFFTSLSVEETQKTDPVKYTQYRFFHSYADALDWLGQAQL